jgi:type VI secretion system protein ImpJ
MAVGNPDLPCAINWSEGMMLSPQHFQQFDKYISAQDYFWASASLSETWGVLELQYDHVNFSQGIFRITRLKAVFPDGTLFDYQQGVMGDLFLDISELTDTLKQRAVRIAIQVPRSHDPSVVSEDKRFVTGLSTAEADETLANNNTIVDRKFLNARLGIFEPGSAKYSSIPLAEFCLEGAVLNFTSYHPRAFRFLENSNLKQRLDELLTTARQKLIFLSEHFQGLSSIKGQLPDGAQFLAFRVLCQILPELEAYYKQNRSPADIFTLIVRFSGSISFLQSLSVPPNGSEFDASELTSSFEPHFDSIERSLAELQKSYSLFDLHAENTVYSIDLSNYHLENKVLIVVENQARLSSEEISVLINQALIGERNSVDEMRRKRTLGAKRKFMTKTEVEYLGLDSSLEVFEIGFDGSLLHSKSFLQVRLQTEENKPVSIKLKLFLKL